MAQIKLELKSQLIDGMDVKFKAPCDCTAVTGLLVYYTTDTGAMANKSFTFRDSHNNNLAGLGGLFASGAYVKAILDVGRGYAYLQNAATNTYVESKVGAIPDGSVTMAKLAASAKPLSFVDRWLSPMWTEVDAHADEGFPYRAQIALSGVTANHFPQVVFSIADAQSGQYAPIAETYNGGVYIYASEAIAEGTTIPCIFCTPTD